MAMLNFKKGLYSALPKTISEGTIYVTTDEKAMYVDISATERIRLGQIVVVDTIEAWEGLKPPFSHEAFYYITESNALMRNNGTADDPKWTQLNSVSDITTDLTNLTQRVDAVERVASGAATAASAAQGAAEAAQTTANQGVQDAATAKSAADAAQERADDAYELAEEAKGIAEQGVQDAAAADSKATAAGTAAATADENAGKAQKRADDAYALAEQANGAASGAQATADKGVQDAADALARANEAYTRGDNAYALAESAGTAAATAGTNAGLAQAAADKNAEDIVKHENRLIAVEKAIGDGDGTSLADRVGALEDTVNDAASGVVKNYERLNAIDTKFNSYSTTEQMNSAIDNKLANYSTTEQMNKAVGDAKTEVTNTFNTKFESYSTTTQMNEAIGAAKEEMSEAIESAIAENDAMTYRGIVSIDEETGEDNLPDGIYHSDEDDQRVKIGYTYKVSKTGYYGPNDELCYVGDLLIANGIEDTDGFITGTITWDHVESGYEEENQPTLSGDNGNIYLTSPIASSADRGDLGKISVMSMNENLKVSVGSNAITMSLEWGTFEEENV